MKTYSNGIGFGFQTLDNKQSVAEKACQSTISRGIESALPRGLGS